MRRPPEPPMVILVDVMTIIIFVLIYLVSRSHPSKLEEPGIVLPPQPYAGAVIVRRMANGSYRRWANSVWKPFRLPRNSLVLSCYPRWRVCSKEDGVVIQGDTFKRIGVEVLRLYDRDDRRDFQNGRTLKIFLDMQGKVSQVQFVPQNGQK